MDLQTCYKKYKTPLLYDAVSRHSPHLTLQYCPSLHVQQAYDLASANAQNMRAMHDKLVKDISELESRKEMIKGKMAVAKTQERLNKMTSNLNGNSSIAAFDRMEAKANAALDKANAMAELNAGPQDSIDDLTAKYANASSDVDDELAALKASLGQQQ